jgi:UDP-2,3-diacylglucosamine pyrophosphatase LpxH
MSREVSYAVVVSDLHFGDSRCSLHSMQTVRQFTEKLKAFAPLREIILLGDILDLQLANWAQALEGNILKGPIKRAVGFRYFINFLLESTGIQSITYVPGNHDYRIFDYHAIQKHLLEPIKKGKKLSGKISFFRTFPDSFLAGILSNQQIGLKVVYPHYTMKVNGSRVILTHGHFFDPTQAFNHEIGKLFSRAEGLSKQEITKLRYKYFRRVSLYQNVISGISTKRELRDWFNALYQPFTGFKEKFDHKIRKTFLTPAMKRSIGNYVRFCCRPGKVEGVIFGHTHRAGRSSFQDSSLLHVWNSGTFLRESNRSRPGSFITIRMDGKTPVAEAVQVHEL